MRTWLWCLVLLALLNSCSKQEPSDVQPDYVDSTSELERGDACRQLDLTRDLLELNNSKYLFKCATWDKTFPTLYSSLETVDVDKWNRLTNPINERFLNDKTARDLLIRITQEMDEKGGLDEFAKVITSLSDSNFFGNIDLVFECTKDPSSCRGEKISRKDIENFFKFFYVDKEALEKGNRLVVKFVELLNQTDMSFFKSLSGALSSKEFTDARYDLFNQFILKFKNNEVKEEIEFLRNIFKGKNNQGKSRVIELVTRNMTVADFNYLIDYSAVKDPNQWKEFRVLDSLLKTNIVCEGFVDDRAMSVNVSDHVNFFVKELFAKDREHFFSQGIESLGILKTAQSLCDKFSFYEEKIVNPITFETEIFTLNYVKAVSKTTKLLMLSSYYNLFDYLQDSVPNTIDNKELFLIKFFSSDFHVAFVQFVATLDAIDSKLVTSVYELLQNSDEEFVDDIVYFLDWILEKDISQVQALGKVWSSLSKEGQFFFFNFLDSHYKEDVDIRLLFSFYSSILSNFTNQITAILNDYFSTPAQLETFLASLEEITDKLGGEELVEDYQIFFSRDHFIEMIKIISQGQVEKGSSSYILGYDPKELKPVGVSVDLNQLVHGDQGRGQCIEDMNENNNDFYDFISEIPSSCRPYIKDNVFFDVIDEINKMGVFINGAGEKWSRHSLFSSDMMKSGTLLLNYLSEEYKSIDGEGVTSIVSDIHRYLQDRTRKENLENSLELINIFNSTTESSTIASLISYYSEDDNFKLLKELFAGLGSSLDLGYDYHRGKLTNILSDTSFREDKSYSCKQYNNSKIGGDPCPNLKNIKFIKDSLVSKFLRKNDNNPTALELILTSILPDYGLMIPYDNTDQTLKRITFGETFLMIYDLTNETLSTNKIDIEYQEIPKAVSSYFNDEWEIEKDMLKTAPDEEIVSMNTMERIETVIRDVRFDANYLGAHYMNAVAKAENYDETVDSKYSLLGMCIPLKFCGKFMNKAQHRLARNSHRTFPGLIDVNKEEGWSYGDYMRALIQVVVASSPDDSQRSTVIDRRILGVKITIPVLQTKEELLYHNGKILSDLSMVSAFSNAGRLIRDRVGRTENAFKNFITSKRMKRFDSKFLNGVSPISLINLVKKIFVIGQDNGYLDTLVSFFYSNEYKKERLLENIGAKFAVLSTYLASEGIPDQYKQRYESLDLLDLDKVVVWAVTNFEDISEILPLKDREFLVDVNYLLDALLFKVEAGDKNTLLLLNEIFLFASKNQDQIISDLDKIRLSGRLGNLKSYIASLPKLLKDLSEFDSSNKISGLLKKLETNDDVSFKSYQKWFAISSATEICYNQQCQKNKAYREVNKTLKYIFENKSSRLIRSINYLAQDKKRELDKLLRKIFSTLTIQ